MFMINILNLFPVFYDQDYEYDESLHDFHEVAGALIWYGVPAKRCGTCGVVVIWSDKIQSAYNNKSLQDYLNEKCPKKVQK
jgi:hypothetical protein